MSNLPTISYQDRSVSLPKHSELVDPKKPLIQSAHRFRPAADISKQLHDYSLAVVDHIEKAFQLKKASGWQGSKFGEAYKRLDTQSNNDDFWRVKETSDGKGLLYAIASSRPNGAWEKFVVRTNKDQKLEKSRWTVNGFIPGDVIYEPKKAEAKRVRLKTLNLASMQRFGSDYRHSENGRMRIHHSLVAQAQWLIDLNRKFKMNGNGVKLGDHRFFVRKLAKQDEGKAIYLQRDAKADPDDTLSSLAVKTDKYGDVIEIVQTHKRANIAYVLLKNGIGDISESAELVLVDKKKKDELYKALEDFDSLEELFQHSDEMTQRLEDNKKHALQEYSDNQKRYSIIVPDSSMEAKQAKEDLFSQVRIDTLMQSLNLLIRPTKALDKVPKELVELYDYAKMQPGQFSFALFTGGVNKVKFPNGDQAAIPLDTFGPVNLRRRFESHGGDNLYRISDGNFRDYLRSIGVSITDEKQDKAIARWTLMQNADELKKLGILIERTSEDTEKIHFVNLSSRDDIRKTKVNISSVPGLNIERNLMRYPSNNVLKALQIKYDLPGKNNTERAIALNSSDELKLLFQELGFTLAKPIETEEYLAKELKGENKAEVQKFLEERANYHNDFYRDELALALLAKELRQQGFEGVKKHKVRTALYLKAQRNGQTYLARALSSKKGLSTKKYKLIEIAEEADLKPLLFLANDIDDQTRSAKLEAKEIAF